MQLARVVLAAGLLLAACLVYLQLLGPEPQPEKELRLARMGFRERCAKDTGIVCMRWWFGIQWCSMLQPASGAKGGVSQ